MRTSTYDELIASMPSGLERAVIQVLKYHVGKDKAAKKGEILAALKQSGLIVHERQFRDAVRNLRRDGWLIGSLSADGYFLVADLREYYEYRDTELSARIADLSETRSAMDSAAKQRFGDAVQVGLL